jgi:two-component system, LytTR family, response regulator
MKRTVCIIDDEFRSRERIRTLLKDSDDFSVVGEADNGREAVDLIDSVLPDIVILDIKMPGLSGFQVLQEAVHKPAVIFVTAYNEHAVRAFDVHAVDYLLKPFQDARFREALSRIPVGATPNSETLKELSSLIEGSVPQSPYLKRITVKDRFEFRVLNIDEIDYFSTDDGIVFLHTNGVRYMIDKTLAQLEESLSPEIFFRAHRKSLVNINRIDRIVPWGRGRYVLKFQNDEKVHLSKDKTREFKLRVGLH